jgi:hypothetical protein
MDDVSEQATGTRTALIITICEETVYCMAVGRSFSFDRVGLTSENFFSSCENFHSDFFSAESFREVFSGFAAPFFYCLTREEFSATWFEPIIFPFDTYGPSGAKGQARKA